MKSTTAEWVEKAEDDYKGARKLARGNDVLHDLVCFHCQQAAEKYLKALMEELGLRIPRTHNLIALQKVLRKTYPTLRPLRAAVDYLTRFAVETRYPGDDTSGRQSKAALKWAKLVRAACRRLLGLPLRRGSK